MEIRYPNRAITIPIAKLYITEFTGVCLCNSSPSTKNTPRMPATMQSWREPASRMVKVAGVSNVQICSRAFGYPEIFSTSFKS